MLPRLLIAAILLMCVAASPRVTLRGEPQSERYAPVAVSGAGPGQHELAGANVMPVQWPGGADVVLPVLVYPGATPVLTLDGDAITAELGEPAGFDWSRDAPAVGAVDERPYLSIAAWRPGRPWAERVTVAVAGLTFAAVVGLVLWLVRRPKARLITLVGLSTLATSAVVAWDRFRPPLAVRRVSIDGDRWLFLANPTPTTQPARVAFVGDTRPVAFSRRHLDSLSPTLICDAAGRPVELRLTLPPNVRAAVVQRTGDGAGDPPLPDWAQPLARRVYGE